MKINIKLYFTDLDCLIIIMICACRNFRTACASAQSQQKVDADIEMLESGLHVL